jgi:hypothetical protein
MGRKRSAPLGGDFDLDMCNFIVLYILVVSLRVIDMAEGCSYMGEGTKKKKSNQPMRRMKERKGKERSGMIFCSRSGQVRN